MSGKGFYVSITRKHNLRAFTGAIRVEKLDELPPHWLSSFVGEDFALSESSSPSSAGGQRSKLTSQSLARPAESAMCRFILKVLFPVIARIVVLTMNRNLVNVPDILL